MTNLVDIAEVPGNLEQVEKDLAEATLSRDAGTESGSSNRSTVEDKLPTKFQGKSREDIAEMYLNLESQSGRMANDLGVQRKLTDRLLDLKRDTDLTRNNPAAKKVEISAVELLDKPTEAIDRYVSAREEAFASRIDERLNRLEGTTAQNAFLSKHPDYTSVAQSQEFVDWVQASSIRKRAAATAYNGDWNVADELLAEYKAVKPSKANKEDTARREAANLQAARGASLDSGASQETPAKNGGKTYRRADLMKLRIDKPDVYYDDSFQSEILLAYSEGRVK